MKNLIIVGHPNTESFCYDGIFKTVKKTNKVIFLQEDTLTGGVGAEICAIISDECFEYLDAPVRRIGSLDTPIPFASELENQFLPIDRFEKAVLELLNY